MHGVEDSPHVVDPPNGWIQNTNNWPYSAAGPVQPEARADFPRYMDTAGENPRGLHAIRVLEGRKDFTLDRLRDAAFDSYLTAFAQLVPPLLAAYDSTRTGRRLAQGEARRADRGAARVGLPLGGGLGADVARGVLGGGAGGASRGATRSADGHADLRLHGDAGDRRPSRSWRRSRPRSTGSRATSARWRTPWGEINRFQRLTGDIVQQFDDAGPSIPVPFTSAQWGSLASFGARTYPGTKRMYGTSGNSFVAVVEFGKDSVRAQGGDGGRGER